jgi:hypothetical protein
MSKKGLSDRILGMKFMKNEQSQEIDKADENTEW